MVKFRFYYRLIHLSSNVLFLWATLLAINLLYHTTCAMYASRLCARQCLSDPPPAWLLKKTVSADLQGWLCVRQQRYHFSGFTTKRYMKSYRKHRLESVPWGDLKSQAVMWQMWHARGQTMPDASCIVIITIIIIIIMSHNVWEPLRRFVILANLLWPRHWRWSRPTSILMNVRRPVLYTRPTPWPRLRNDIKCVEWDVKPYYSHLSWLRQRAQLSAAATSAFIRATWYWYASTAHILIDVSQSCHFMD